MAADGKIFSASLLLIAGLLLGELPANAGPEAQQIKLGQYVFHVPQKLFASQPYSYSVVMLDNKSVDNPRQTQLEANELIIGMGGITALGLNDGVAIPPARSSSFVRWGDTHHVPYQIRLSDGAALGDWSKRAPLGVEQNRKMVEAAASLDPDANGFVRVNRNFLVYKGSNYQTATGDALVVMLPPEAKANGPSFDIGMISTALQKDFFLFYLFATRDSSSVGLWEMHQHVVSCVERLLQPANDSGC
jgi:hypothetical protein